METYDSGKLRKLEARAEAAHLAYRARNESFHAVRDRLTEVEQRINDAKAAHQEPNRRDTVRASELREEFTRLGDERDELSRSHHCARQLLERCQAFIEQHDLEGR